MKTAYQYGQEAFSRNCPWNPQLDEEFMAQKDPDIAQWKAGWIRQSLKYFK